MNEVILYSAGMDSHVLAHAFPDAQLVYIDSGARYSKKERESIKRTAPRDVTVVDGVLDLSRYEREDAIVPARNLLLATVASFYGERIYIGATAGDNSTDKDFEFARLAGGVLSHVYDSHHFPGKGEVSIELPLKNMAKSALVEWYRGEFGEADTLAATTSCYSSDDGHCGACKACLRKWLAFEVNGIALDSMFALNPRDWDGWQMLVKQIRTGTPWRGAAEDADVLSMFG